MATLSLVGCSDAGSWSDESDPEKKRNYAGVTASPVVFPEGTGGTSSGGSSSGGSASGGSSSGGTATGGSSTGGTGGGNFIDPDPPRTVSMHCGDRVHDAALEECDDGPLPEGGISDGICSDNCQTRDTLVTSALNSVTRHRTFGFGRHPFAASHVPEIAKRKSAGALAWIEKSTPPAAMSLSVELMLLDTHGNAVEPVEVSAGAHPTSFANPVVAGLGDGSYAVLWNDLNGDGAELGVALRRVIPGESAATLSSLRFANTTTVGAQQDPDAVWTSGGLVVAWTDTSNSETAPDIRFRTFDKTLSAVTTESTLAETDLPETAVSLVAHESSWAAAYRRAEVDGTESIVVVQGTKRVVVDPTEAFTPGSDMDRPALASLDADHLFVAFTVGTDPEETGVANVRRLWGAVVELSSSSVTWSGAIEPLVEQTRDDATRGQLQPTAAAVGRTANGQNVFAGNRNQLFLAWRSESELGNRAGEDLWLKRLDWDGTTLVTTIEETSLSRDCAQVPLVYEDLERGDGDQRTPVLMMLDIPGSPAIGSKALGIAWEDWGKTFESTQASPDVAMSLAPLPLRRGPPVEEDCSSSSRCEEGEGPCDNDGECVAGLACRAKGGPWYGYGVDTGVCVVPHCANGEPDFDEDPSQEDCGGADCAPCFDCPNEGTHSGTAHFCSAVCRCSDKQGDCDYESDCEEGLACYEDQGQYVGHPGTDACFKPSCFNGIKDINENRLDCGQNCPDCTLGTENFCSTSVTCSEGQGSCSADNECGVGLKCDFSQEQYYGLPSGTGVCIPTTCASNRGTPQQPGFCSSGCRCPDGYGACTSDDQCLGAGSGGECRLGRGLYFGSQVTAGICLPDHCVDGVKNNGETQIDCGGGCGTECPACSASPAFRSFEYPADSTAAVGSRGWEDAGADSDITWTKSSSDKTDGAQSLKFAGCGFSRIRSPSFSATDFEIVGDQMLIDLKLGTNSGNAPPTGRYLGEYKLRLVEANGVKTELFAGTFSPAGANSWATLSIPVSGALRDLFLSATTDLRLELDLGLNCGLSDPLFMGLDNLRFGGNAVFQSTCGSSGGSSNPGIDTLRNVLGFESASVWTSSQVTPTTSSTKTQGTSSLELSAISSTLTSASVPMKTFRAAGVLALDWLTPAAASGQTLGGSISLFMTCPSHGLLDRELANQSIAAGSTRVPSNQWITLPFILTSDLLNVFGGAGQCSFKIQTNLTGVQAGATLKYDNLRFVPLNSCNTNIQIPTAPFRIDAAPPTGFVSNPYRICLPSQVQTVMSTSSLWASHFKVDQNIDLAGVNGSIGSTATPYSGTFDGQNFELSNYSRIEPSSSYVGLFGKLNGTVKNLVTSNFSVSGASAVGTLLGLSNGTVRNVHAYSGRAVGTASSSLIGGLVGWNEGSVIENSSASVHVSAGTGSTHVGGIVGGNTFGNVLGCTARGPVVVQAGVYVGGLIGASHGGIARDSTSTGDVSGSGGQFGGLLGTAQGAMMTVERCQAHGRVEATNYVGGLVGSGFSASPNVVKSIRIVDSVSTGTVVTTVGSYAGGLAGLLETGEVLRSSSSSTVNGAYVSGGLVGWALGATAIERSFATGNVTAIATSGGLLGYVAASTIQDSYARGNVTLTGSEAGGLVGRAESATIRRSYGSGSVASSGHKGTIVGYHVTSTFDSAIGNSTVNTSVNPIGNATGVAGTENFASSAFLVLDNFTTRGWDTSFVWKWASPAPELLPDVCGAMTLSSSAPFVTNLPIAPDGTVSSPYPLCNAAQVQTVINTSTLWSKHFALLADIDLAAVNGSIGNSTTPFTGTFDGRSFKLSNYTRTLSVSEVGFFGVVLGDGVVDGVADGVIKNLTIQNFVIGGVSQLGTLVGKATMSVVSNVQAVGGSVTGSGSQVGGFIGFNTGTITNCTSSVNAVLNNGISDSGGFVGLNSGTISSSHNTGTFTANWTANGSSTVVSMGGFVGQNGTNGWGPGVIEFCTSSGSVVAKAGEVGGLVGTHQGTASIIRGSSSSGLVDQNDTALNHTGGLVGRMVSGTIEDSFSSSVVDSRFERVGGLVGSVDAGLIEDSYATGSVTARVNRAGGLVGSVPTAATIRRTSATGHVTSETGATVGGLIGLCENLTLQDSYARGNVSGSQNAGGLIGHATTCTITRTYAAGAVTATSDKGRLIGEVVSTGTTATASLANSTVNSGLSFIGLGSATTTNSSSVTSTQLNTESTYTSRGWNFTTVWIMGTGGAVLQ